MGWRRTRRRRAGASQLTRAARKGTLWPAHGERPAAAVWHRSRACIPHTCPGAAFFRLHSNTGPWGRTGAAAAAAAAAAAVPRRRLNALCLYASTPMPLWSLPLQSLPLCLFATLPLCLFASLPLCLLLFAWYVRAPGVCSNTHPEHDPFEATRTQQGRDRQRQQQRQQRHGGARPAFFVLSCCALV